tara:strand:+ start:879 stop:1106 length:228 start_codon:yes stop_codon:yes gene_type:complete
LGPGRDLQPRLIDFLRPYLQERFLERLETFFLDLLLDFIILGPGRDLQPRLMDFLRPYLQGDRERFLIDLRNAIF